MPLPNLAVPVARSHVLVLIACFLLCRSDKGKRHQQPEADFQAKCVEWMKEKSFLFVASAVGVYAGGARSFAALQRRGVEGGVPDLLVLEPKADGSAGILCVELKVGKNGLGEKQEKWLYRAKARGHTVDVCKSLDQFKKTVLRHIHGGSGTEEEPFML